MSKDEKPKLKLFKESKPLQAYVLLNGARRFLEGTKNDDVLVNLIGTMDLLFDNLTPKERRLIEGKVE